MATSPTRLCSAHSRDCGEDPAGSAGWYRHFIFLQLPLPWKGKVWESRHVPAHLQALLETWETAQLRVRVMGVIPREKRDGVPPLVIHYQRAPDGEPFSGFSRKAYAVNLEDAAKLLPALISGETVPPRFPALPQNAEPERELFVCTHGSRDICCGKLGYPVYEELRSKYAEPSKGTIQVWRVSHTGGHRFAPTLLDFPDGMYWGRMDLERVAAVMNRTGEASSYSDAFRGCAAFAPHAQIADRALFLREGWSWLTCSRSLNVLERTDDGHRTRVGVKWVDKGGNSHTQTARVEQKDTVLTLMSTGAPDLTEIPRYEVILYDGD